jgi:type IV secretion system protein VirB4
MLGKFFSKKPTNEIRMETPVPDFIPYACHYDGDTILTKNGELLQTIKITGFSNESIGSENIDLRNVVRQAILDNIKNDNFALWIHTVRRKTNLDPGGAFPTGFSDQLNKSWKERHHWNEMYVNEVYITIIRDGKSATLTSSADFLGSLYFNSLKKTHEKFLKTTHKELISSVNGMLQTLHNFGAKRLSAVEENGIFHSEPLQFFSKILNLAESPVPMPISDISEYIANHKIAIGFNTMEVRGATGKHFGAIFTVKEYQEIPITSMDTFLQLPQEFIITQTLDFIDSKKALKEFKKQQYILKVSRDSELSEAVGLDYMMQSNNGSSTAFGNSQMTIMMINDDLGRLEKDIKHAHEKLGKLGMVITRNDLRLEECFWAQLPGNFSYVTRKRPISTFLVGGFASLFNFPAGKRIGNLWGQAVTMFHTAIGTPYFFSFHDGNNGHTIILGPQGSGTTVLMNFMVSESRKFNGRLFFFDQHHASKIFIKSIGGNYIDIEPTKASPKQAFNPLCLEDTDNNRKFLKKWIVLLAESSGDLVLISEAEKAHIESLIDYIFTVPVDSRKLSVLEKSFGPITPGSLGEKMSIWYGSGKYAHLFDNNAKDIMPMDGMIYGFDMSPVVNDQVTLGPVLSFLFHRIELTLDGTPTIIVLDEAWNLVNNAIFAPGLVDWLSRLKEKNALVIFASQAVPNTKKSGMTKAISDIIATKIFTPNLDAEDASIAYKNVWGLSAEEFDMLARMRPDKRHFMLKQDGDSIVATLNLSGLNELHVLSASDKTVTMMESAITEKGENPENWLPAFYKGFNIE